MGWSCRGLSRRCPRWLSLAWDDGSLILGTLSSLPALKWAAASLRVLEGFGGVLVRLLGEFVCGEVVAFVVRCGGCLVGVSGFVVEFGGSFVWALRHGGSPCDWMG